MVKLNSLGRSFLPLVTSVALMSGCALNPFAGDRPEPIGPTLAKLEPTAEPAREMSVPKIELDAIEQLYQRALTANSDPLIKHNIGIRLAELEMMRSENRQLSATTNQRFFDQTIDLYKQLIADDPDQEGRDQLLYQLAKAYELDGRMGEAQRTLDQLVREYPNSPLLAEAQFRRAEAAFSAGNYGAAEKNYAAVVKRGSESQFANTAQYMQGWSRFKRGRYDAALISFTEVMDSLLPEIGSADTLNKNQLNLLQDTQRVMAMAFSYLDGPVTIAENFDRVGSRHYEHTLYRALADLYLEKKRYRDSAETFEGFVDRYPQSPRAPEFAVAAIGVYEKGGFGQLLLPAKENFVTRFGVSSEYWTQMGEEDRDGLRQYLAVYIDEIASHQHAQAQLLDQQFAKQQTQRNQGKSIAAKQRIAKSQVAEQYLLAAHWYNQYLLTFPEHPSLPKYNFLMAEALQEGGDLAAAIAAYERVAYELQPPQWQHQYGANAGYSALLLWQQLQTDNADNVEQLHQLQQQQLASAYLFVDSFQGDERSATILAQIADTEFKLHHYQEASAAAYRLTQYQPEPQGKILETAWLVFAHASFELQKFDQAEVGYRKLLTVYPAQSKQWLSINERLAASIYRSAEQLLAAEDKRGAAERFFAVAEVDANSDIGMTAQFDGANLLMELQDWQQAAFKFEHFQSAYPTHPLTASIPAKLVVIFQELQWWQRTADVLGSMSYDDKSPEVRRQSLYMAGEMALKADNISQAIHYFRRYAHNHPQPFDQVTEARYQMSELYVRTKEPLKRNFWLSKMISGHDQAGAEQTDRSRYLAAYSSNELAQQQFQRFAAIKLKLPLKNSLKKKRKAMEKTLDAYQKALTYQVEEFSTQANYRVGDIYAQLSRDLMDSQRPKGLDALALEQYEILLEEQAYPFEEKAIEVHQSNAQLSWNGVYNQWVKESFEALAKLMPGRYAKKEPLLNVSEGIY